MLYKRLQKLSILFCLNLFLILACPAYCIANNTPKIISNSYSNPSFVGRRQELNRIKDYYTKGKTVVSIVGISGIGKSEIIQEYINQNKKEYDIIWIFDGSLDLRYQFQSLSKEISIKYNLNNKLSEDLNDAENDVLEFLKNKDRSLLIIDNVRIGGNIKLKSILTHENFKGKILIASQDKNKLPNVIPIKELDNSNSQLLLNKYCPNLIITSQEKILQLFKGYPLGIVKAAEFINQNEYINFEEYLELIKNDPFNNKVKELLSILIKNIKNESKDLLIKASLLDNHNLNKNLIKALSNNQAGFIHYVYELNRYGILEYNKTELDFNEASQNFHIHDLINNNILEILSTEEIKIKLIEIINSINEIFPDDVTNLPLFLNKFGFFRENLEALLVNLEKYEIDVFNMINIRSKLIRNYMQNLDYTKVETNVKWFEQKHKEKLLNINSLNDGHKYTLANILTDIGVFYNFYHGNAAISIDYLNRAKDIAIKLNNDPKNLHLKFTIFAQLAQTYAYAGDIESTNTNLYAAEQYINKIKGNAYWGLLGFLKSFAAYQSGNYLDAILEIDKVIENEKNLPQGEFTAPPYLLKAELLLKINDIENSYLISKKVFDSNFKRFMGTNEFEARVRLILANSEFLLGNNNYKNNLLIATKILEQLPSNTNKPVNELDDNDLASCYILSGDIYLTKNKYDLAIKKYKQGLMILKNRFKENLKNDYISNVIKKITIAYRKNNELGKSSLYVSEHEDIFGFNDFRTKELYTISRKELSLN